CCTQNIDQLHKRAGLSTGLGDEVQCVPLHGTIDVLRCTSCCKTFQWTDQEDSVIAGQDPRCPGCPDAPRKAEAPPRRSSTIGWLRPNIVCLEEVHPQGEDIADVIKRDISARPDMFLVLGTSLKLSGPWDLVRGFARTVRADGGKVIFVNRTKASQRGCNGVFDYWIEWECDSWVGDLIRRGGFSCSLVVGSVPTRPRTTLGGHVSKQQKRRQGKESVDRPGSSFNNPIVLD
ncbi:DHS-like NAD/FAD-binding domain-containing protein, partial [Dichotomopilus funicola]